MQKGSIVDRFKKVKLMGIWAERVVKSSLEKWNLSDRLKDVEHLHEEGVW